MRARPLPVERVPIPESCIEWNGARQRCGRAARYLKPRDGAVANIETNGVHTGYFLGIVMKQERVNMCDYSLHNVASRPARVGDKLTTTRFPHTMTCGFCAIGEPNVAVCLLPGTEIAFEAEVERQADPLQLAFFGIVSLFTKRKWWKVPHR